MKDIKNIFVRETLRLRSRSSAWILIIFIPVFIFLYLGAIYEEGAVQLVKVGVLDHDKSPFSQQIIDNDLAIKTTYEDLEQVKNVINQHKESLKKIN